MDNRKIDLAERKEEIKSKKPAVVIRFELEQINQHYQESIDAINEMSSIADRLLIHEELLI